MLNRTCWSAYVLSFAFPPLLCIIARGAACAPGCQDARACCSAGACAHSGAASAVKMLVPQSLDDSETSGTTCACQRTPRNRY